jgi:photosystem II stability/assembly factor-like uncharacterized protein
MNSIMKFTLPLKIMLFLALYGCKNSKPLPVFSAVQIIPIIEDSLLNIRALELDKKALVAVSSLGDVYRYDLELKKLSKNRFTKDTLNIRSMALLDETVLALSIASPAYLYKNSKLVYSESDEAVFYDSMDFWNSQDGIAMGDPTADCLSILITRDGGENWYKIPCDQLPKAVNGEAAFAASDTNISIVGNDVWIASGGMASRVFYSSDKGRSWTVFDTPIVQGTPTTGMYSIDFYDIKNGVAVGGDYTQPKSNINTVIKTSDGGQTWFAVGDENNPGYRSCVQYVPNSDAKGLVAIGFEGIDYSSNGGTSWTSLSDEGFYTFRFLNDSTAFAAGKGRIVQLDFKSKKN